MADIKFEHRYNRNFNTLSMEEQKKLADSKVAVFGLGGLGGGVTEMLARVGVGHLTLIDGDFFDASNLNRQILSQENLIGVSKAQAAKDRVNSINSQVRVIHLNQYLDESNMYDPIKEADLAVDCLDSIDSRFNLQTAARKADIPIVSGAIAGVTGQVTTIFPQDRGYELIYGKKAESQSKGVETRTGNISYCALWVASVQSSECVKVLLGRGELLKNKLLIAELWSNTFDIMDLI